MGVKEFLDYDAYISYMDKQLEVWGQPCTIFNPERKIALGYEDTTHNEVNRMNGDTVLGNLYHKSQGRIWINFTVEKKVFYKFNFFPDDSEKLCTAFINSSSQVHENDYIRTAIPEATSIWGDLIMEVRAIKDIGFANVLQRVYFLKPTGNLDLHNELSF